MTMTGLALGVGAYSVPEAGRLTRIHPGRIRRWIHGYAYRTPRERRSSPPVWRGQLPRMDHSTALGFLDLQEVRFVDAFRKAGVPWSTIREVSRRAESLFGTRHPFCTQQFKTDGRELFLQVIESGRPPILVEVLRSQAYFRQVIAPFFKDLEFENRHPVRWWPMGSRRKVVLDPARSFGKPIVSIEGIPTAILAEAFRAEKSLKAVAYWYEVSPNAVADAVEFERRLAA